MHSWLTFFPTTKNHLSLSYIMSIIENRQTIMKNTFRLSSTQALKKLSTPLLFFLFAISGQAQEISSLSELKQHVTILADDKMEGRETGTKGEMMAAEYIIDQFKAVGVEGKGDKGSYLQAFDVLAGRLYGKNNRLQLRKESLTVERDFYALEFSGNGTAKGKLEEVGYGIVAPEDKVNDYAKKKNLAGKIFVIEVATPIDGSTPHSAIAQFTDLKYKAEVAEKKGAAAVVFINSGEGESPIPDYTKRITPLSIPVVFAIDSKRIKKQLCKEAEVAVDLIKDERTGHNVIGWIDNDAAETVVIGGHYDHLGYGAFGSLHTGKEPEIHNGADDNASGISVMIELAKQLKKDKNAKGYNYMFIGFSGEEMGLLGSSYFVNQPTIPLEQISYMFNMDMVGRIKNRTLTVHGTGTSPAWGNLIVTATPKAWALNIQSLESGVGPTDHTSFYLKNIPVLGFFSGTHSDYHKPSDDPETLNYSGMRQVQDLMYNIIMASQDMGKLEFTKTKDSQDKGGMRRFNVTLGVMPNYGYSGKGMKIDGVSEGKAADKAGFLPDDIIVKMGDLDVKDIYDYMDALGKFNPGDSTKVVVERKGEEVELDVEF